MKDPKDTLDVIFTVDVENELGNVPYRIEGDLSEFGIKENCGINYIMDTFSAHNAKLVCFVNIYEHKKYEPGYMPSLLRRIAQRGHEVALHAHKPLPGHLPFYTNDLSECSLAEQKQILTYGRNYIFRATGKFPVSFRGGAYRINDFIFKALNDTGFQVDSSVFYMDRRNGKLKEYAHRKNQIFRASGIIEIPVVVIWNGHTWRKLDINWLTEDELISAFEIMRKSSMYRVAQCMFHSFSFLENQGKGDVRGERKEEKKKLENLLKFLRSSDKYRILTFEEYLKEDPYVPDDDVLYLANRELAWKYSNIEVLYDENVVTLVNHFHSDGVKYAWEVYPVEGKGQGPKYNSGYQFSNTYRIELNEQANGEYYISSYMQGKDEKRVSITLYSVTISHGKVLSVKQRF